GVRVARLDRRGDRAMMLVDRPVEARAELRAGEVALEDGEDRLRGDRQQRVPRALDHGEVEVLVADELPLGAEAERLVGDRVAPPRREPRGGDLEELPRLEQLLERDVVGVREQRDAGLDELGDAADARQGDVRAAAGALGGTDQVLRRQDAERLADRRATDAEMDGEGGLVREPLAGLQLAVDDAVA